MTTHTISITLCLALIIAIINNVAVGMSVVERFATNSWCTKCYIPQSISKVKMELEAAFPASVASKCGDGFCNLNQLENCDNCAQDCGKCNYSTALSSCVNPKHISLTFDDGPSEFTDALLNILKTNNVKATFFVLGQILVAGEGESATINPEKLAITNAAIKRAYAEGHTIGTHTYTHVNIVSGEVAPGKNTARRDTGVTAAQLYATDRVISDIIGVRPRLFRPPYLETDSLSLGAIESMGFIPIVVNVDTNDWRYEGSTLAAAKPLILSNVQSEIKMAATETPTRGFITLQHDIINLSVQSVNDLIANITKKNGLTIVPMDICLGIPPAKLYRAKNDSNFVALSLSLQKPATNESSVNGTGTNNNSTSITIVSSGSKLLPLSIISKIGSADFMTKTSMLLVTFGLSAILLA